MPKRGEKNRTQNTPPKKKLVPLILSGLPKKKRKADENPIMQVTPAINMTFPMARSPPSKKSSIPSIKKATPKAVRPIPIFCVSDKSKSISAEGGANQITIIVRKKELISYNYNKSKSAHKGWLLIFSFLTSLLLTIPPSFSYLLENPSKIKKKSTP